MKKYQNTIFTIVKFIFWIYYLKLLLTLLDILIYTIYDFSQDYNFIDITFFILKTIIILLKTFLANQVYLILSKLDLHSPFNKIFQNKLSNIAYLALGIGILTFLINFSMRIIDNIKLPPILNENTENFLFPASIIFILSIIYNRALELKNENDLTI